MCDRPFEGRSCCEAACENIVVYLFAIGVWIGLES